MSKIRLHMVVLFLGAALICAVSAKPRTPKQKAQDKCDMTYFNCINACPNGGASGSGMSNQICQHNCVNQLDACYKKAGISAPPGGSTKLPTDNQTLTTGQPSPTATPKSKLPPTAPLTQVSPTATPKRLTRQPQGTLTQASPSASPNTIFHATKKENKKGGH